MSSNSDIAATQAIRKTAEVEFSHDTDLENAPSETAPLLDPKRTQPSDNGGVANGNVFYLAYGSNLNEKIFRGRRGVRPLNQTAVLAPSLNLCFNLPGIPYVEPRFANVATRSLPADFEIDLNNPLLIDTFEIAEVEGKKQKVTPSDWKYGVVGVVYEITRSDYLKIISTEGGGSHYKEVEVECYRLPTAQGSEDSTAITGPIVARTLQYQQPVETDDVPKSWSELFWHLFGGIERHGYEAHPSPRYLNLIRQGAREHNLPVAYQSFLEHLQEFRTDSLRLVLARVVIYVTVYPTVFFIVTAGKRLSDENGRFPYWLANFFSFATRTTWISYRLIFRYIFGDGEHNHA